MDSATFYSEFGRRLAARRKGIDATQAEIGHLLGTSRASVANMEAGRQRLYVHQLYDLARALRLEDLSQLLPTQVPSSPEDTPLDPRHDVSAVQRAQIEGVLRSAVASARPKARP